MTKQYNQILKHIPVFNCLNETQLAELSGITRVRRYKKGMFVFWEGEEGDAFYFIIKGKIKLCKSLDDGREQILHFAGAGDIFAEILLFDGGNYPATAEVLEDAEIGMIRNPDLDEFLKAHADITLAILKEMSRRLRQAQIQIRDLALKDTYSRLVSTLVMLMEEHQLQEGAVEINLTQQQLANFIGTSRETMSRALNDLKKNGLVDVDRQRIVVLDPEKLRHWY